VTIFYPDISAFQGNISLAGTVAVCAKATQGTGWTSANYAWQKGEAARRGAFFFAYHFLEQGNGAAQADHCFNVVGKTPLMLDWEETTHSDPGVADAVAFIDRFRALGGIVNLVYLPHWYWNKIGSPSLAPIISRGLKNVTSVYTSYSDTGPGWASVGGLPTAIWQFSATFSFNGQQVDFNAFKGTVAELAALVGGKAAPVKPEDLVLKQGDSGTAVAYLQKRLNVWGAKLTVDSSFGALTLAAVKAFQTKEKLTVDGVVGPATWAALDKTPPPPSGAFAAPTGLAVAGKKVSVGVKWNAVAAVNGKAPTGYQAQCYQMNGVKVGDVTVTGTSARFDNLVPGWQYKIVVWATGGAVAPPSAQLTVTA